MASEGLSRAGLTERVLSEAVKAWTSQKEIALSFKQNGVGTGELGERLAFIAASYKAGKGSDLSLGNLASAKDLLQEAGRRASSLSDLRKTSSQETMT